ncbi:PREDICTED: glyoxylate reductase/hydroxypyruvate reductase-like isoform X1 [Trachymyrmex cornetzi]|nr:PREDICTED: glyoxylate reductase/hydroxypyruvate reductase-like isoform X1 [Trachymyrmex cornetzi]XP_018373736.1 PREDICTED: glyoxylate reductase/hydroxypyruvate reductase-like isoform X1 [Trachymyrmex cornetzi]XP_018373737.1 PREDICTED: glyoxylate reductase/hydroxypyruvate reductase-like isoform X1 [Trachymyrmex cornetzi]XP_018373738.1 PREDICTED: glyoxylate reductase/hydroxypyruvate reductase-like isoform X1 [Trachymyrmex cornetzi]
MSLPAALPCVLLSSNDVPAPGIDLLRTKCDVTIIPASISTREQMLQALPGHDAVFLASHHIVNSEFLDVAGPNLKVVSTMSAGYDHLDVPEIKRRGIKVGHTPMVLSAAVAEIAVLLMLSAARRVHEGRMKLEEGESKSRPQWLLGQDLQGSTVGIFGLGNIGQAIVKRLMGFEVGRFIYTGHSRKKAGDELGATFVSLNELLEQSDFIVISATLNNETRGLFDDNTFDKMKKTAIFVNVSRGQIVNTDSLVRALRNKKIFAAGLDVTEPEPLPPGHELLKLPNVAITPHIGSATIKTRNDMSIIAAQNILNGLEDKPLVYPL